MRMRLAAPLVLLSVLVAACGTKAEPGSSEEQQSPAERDALMNAVEEHPSLQNEDLAGPPIDVPTTIPPPAPDGMAGHEGMNMQEPTNTQAPETNEQSPPTT
ncbi:MAG TPA: hypothetical protein VGE68_05285 [Sphingomicrobium sp.]